MAGGQAQKLVILPKELASEGVVARWAVGVRARVAGEERYVVPKDKLGAICRFLRVKQTVVSLRRTSQKNVWLAETKNGVLPERTAGRAATSPSSRKIFMELCGSGVRNEEIRKLEQKVRDAQKRVVKLQAQLATEIRKADDHRREITQLSSVQTKAAEFGSEFDRLLEHPDILRIEVQKDRILVWTRRITISHQGVVYSIGKFKISIRTNPQKTRRRRVSEVWGGNHYENTGEPVELVRFINLSGAIDGNHHPHVNDRGSPCLGNIQELVPQLVGERKFGALISVCIQYLKSYTEEEGGFRPFLQIDRWPIARGE